jgi:hypothetical protein
MKIEYSSITMSPTEYQAKLTAHSHETIRYLARKGYLTDDEKTIELLETIVVVPIANNHLFGRIREYLFGKDSKEDRESVCYKVTQID